MSIPFGFGQPWWLLLLPLLVWWFWRQGRAGTAAAVTHSSTGLLARLGQPPLGRPGRILRVLRFVVMAVFIIALARPRTPQGERPDPSKGIDIMMVCDCSMSMDTKDFTLGAKKITRREALLAAISEFVDHRTNDRVGMIGFATYTYLLSPLTTDGNWIKDVYKLVVLKGGTAIGDGIAAGVNKLEEDPSRSKVMILVTDGLNNAGSNPLEVAAYAKEKGVRIYALEIMDLKRIRTAGAKKSPLAEVATKTGGQYFQAADTGALLQIYRQIDTMEKRETDNKRYMLFNELFLWCGGAIKAGQRAVKPGHCA
ncbi:MAG: VWA domain-containing protein, partial [Verrucomicrobiota bacterium]